MSAGIVVKPLLPIFLQGGENRVGDRARDVVNAGKVQMPTTCKHEGKVEGVRKKANGWAP